MVQHDWGQDHVHIEEEAEAKTACQLHGATDEKALPDGAWQSPVSRPCAADTWIILTSRACSLPSGQQ